MRSFGGTRWAEWMRQDLRFALRMLRRRPGFTIVAVLSLGLGIGANTAVFSVMDALLLRKLPVKNPEQLVLFGEGRMSGVTNDVPKRSVQLFSQPFYWRARARRDVFSGIAAVESMWGDVAARFEGRAGEPELVKIELVSGNYFDVLGVGASLGRVLRPDDERTPGDAAVAVMSYRYWQRRFAGDPGVVGRTFSLRGSVSTVIGVAAPEFFGTEVGRTPDLWAPLAAQAQVQPWLKDPLDPLKQSLRLIGRMQPGVEIGRAQVYTNVVFQQWLHELAGPSPGEELVSDMRKARVQLTDAARGTSHLRAQFSRPLQILLVLVAVVLSIACVNLANLLLARASTRRREIALRLSLGAGRGRLIGQLLAESLLLALAGGCLGLWIAQAGGRLLVAMVASDAQRLSLEPGLSGPVLLFTLIVSLTTGLLFGVVPALRMTHVELAPSLSEGKGAARSQSHRRTGHLLVMGQVALAFLLVIGAALFVTTFRQLEQADLGFERSRVLVLELNSDAVGASGPALMSLYRRVEARIQSLQGVEAASFAMLTFHEGKWSAPVWPHGVAHSERTATSFSGNRVGASYFQALGTPLVMGRGFSPRDTPNSPPVAIVNETFARTLFPHGPAVGRRFSMGGQEEYEIAGVVKDARYQSVRDAPEGVFFVYNGQAQNPDGFNDLVVRAKDRPEALLGMVRAALREENPNLSIARARTLAQVVDESLGKEKLLANLAAFFGGVALLLCCLGLYGVFAYMVARRTNEIGIRMALGARPARILRDVLSEALLVVSGGLAIGLVGALACGRLVASQLYGVEAGDPVLIGVAACLVLLAGLGAGWVPARRAALLDPVVALREE